MAAPSFFRLFGIFFLSTFLPYGIGMTAFCIILSGSPLVGVLLGGSGALVFAVVVAAILAGLHKRALAGLPAGRDDNPLLVHQWRAVDVAVPYEDAFNLCLSSLGCLGRSQVTVADLEHGFLSAGASSASSRRLGQVVFFEVESISESRTRITVHSKLRRKIDLIDYGKNLENVLTIVRFLDKYSEQGLSP